MARAFFVYKNHIFVYYFVYGGTNSYNKAIIIWLCSDVRVNIDRNNKSIMTEFTWCELFL